MGIKHVDVKATGQRGYATEWNKDHTIDGDVDFEQHEAQNFVLENLAAYPGGPVEGQIIYRSDLHKFFVWNGTGWGGPPSPVTIVVAEDGSGDYTTIQAGINALPAEGGLILVKEGTYTVSATITISTNNVYLKGCGTATTIKIANGANINALTLSACSYVTVESLKIDGNGANQTLTSHGVHLVTTPDHIRILNCTVSDCRDNGINGADQLTDSVIAFNVLEENGQDGIYLTAAGPNYTRRVIISSNNIAGNGGQGISVSFAEHVIIEGNTVDGNGAAPTGGISIGSSDYFAVNDNIVTDNGADGITIYNSTDRCTITGNVSENNTVDGIKIDAAACERNIVLGNICFNNGGAQIQDNGTNTIVANNQIL